MRTPINVVRAHVINAVEKKRRLERENGNAVITIPLTSKEAKTLGVDHMSVPCLRVVVVIPDEERAIEIREV